MPLSPIWHDRARALVTDGRLNGQLFMDGQHQQDGFAQGGGRLDAA